MNRKRFNPVSVILKPLIASGPAAALVAALLFLGACKTGVEPETDKKEFYNLSYGSGANQKLDLIFPDIPANIAGPIPAVLYIHGGSWISSDKGEDTFGSVKKSAAATGLAAASMNYRLLIDPPGTVCVDMLDDVHAAIGLVKTKSLELGVKVDKLCIVGVSAGAHLALLYSYTRGGTSLLPIEFCVSASGPADFTDPAWYSTSWESVLNMDAKLLVVSGLTGKTFTQADYGALQKGEAVDQDKRDALGNISPVKYAAGAVPTLLAHGKKDRVVPFSNATRLRDALPNGKRLGFFEFPNSDHDLNADAAISDAFFEKVQKLFTDLKG
jgi:acetyl esterase/lipase